MATSTTPTKTNNQPKGTNAMAIAGFVTSFFVSILGIIFGAIGLSQIKKTGESGKGLAVAGVVIGSVFTGLWVIGIVVMVIASIFAASTLTNLNVDCGYDYEYRNGSYQYTYNCD
jgi:peptidyl-prolyl cis-trans isomerase B (cyclophilin B)